jgi:hypothetical protein
MGAQYMQAKSTSPDPQHLGTPREANLHRPTEGHVPSSVNCWKLEERQRPGMEPRGHRQVLGATLSHPNPTRAVGPLSTGGMVEGPPHPSSQPPRSPGRATSSPLEGGYGAGLTLAEVGKDVMHLEPCSRGAHPGVAIAEAAAAASRIVGLQVKSPRATPVREARDAHKGHMTWPGRAGLG